jgi:hypothetical protein
MSNALTKLVTLDADTTELIDGELTRPMWAGETAVLYCDGTGWIKIMGRTKAMLCSGINSAATAIAHNTAVKVTLGTLGAESISGMLSTANNRIIAQRKGSYLISAIVSYELTGTAVAGAEAYVTVYKNVSPAVSPAITIQTPTSTSGSNTFAMPSASGRIDLNAGDYVEVFGFQTTGSSMNTRTVVGHVKSNLVLTEVPTW